MTRKQVPIAVSVGDGVLIKHCDDLPFARDLARAQLWSDAGGRDDDDPDDYDPEEGQLIWCRILHALPNSWAAREGYTWHYEQVDGPSRGVFRAVVFGG